MEVVVKLLLAYLLGTVMGGQIVGALRGGIDLRKTGSGNVGATNALRTQGAAFALGVLAIDVLKGVVAVLLVPQLPWPWGAGDVPVQTVAYGCGVMVALGHCYPLFYRFQGGKGVATLAGVFACLLPLAVGWMLASFVLVVMLTGYVSLATLTASLVALLHIACFSPQGLWSMTGAFGIAMATLVVWKHRSNVRNLIEGSEHRFEKARVLGRWLSR
ncbi:glycerol-3-phosphate 1-O-acyltransferase PlsY [Flagellatimonas centrodinii]|uniref:glycerol-3-phosphate 1-O-acyltransferase PlsY n=1 Tax=Flagellatimonas centrodinii TaxID=2806210 RepID=UPI001FED4BE1|nr:glycerol-3-phosphate 1-O-acyltransferase PlsY [Flagellatimonas centrodinii]ULQ45253.1 glycerol-3-phosphate 1-O-acyltransferase PlsY [Flagellatimonas centrodinii]